jgi:hypothetical protein
VDTPRPRFRLTNLTDLNLRRNIFSLPLGDLAAHADPGVLFEFLRTLAHARGETLHNFAAKVDHYVAPTRWLDLSRRPYKILPREVRPPPERRVRLMMTYRSTRPSWDVEQKEKDTFKHVCGGDGEEWRRTLAGVAACGCGCRRDIGRVSD